MKEYIANYNIDPTGYPESIAKFLDYSKDNNLPAPSISYDENKLTNNKDKMEIMAKFEIFNYATNGIIETVHWGTLLFSLVRNNLKWEIDSVRVFNDMKIPR